MTDTSADGAFADYVSRLQALSARKPADKPLRQWEGRCWPVGGTGTFRGSIRLPFDRQPRSIQIWPTFDGYSIQIEGLVVAERSRDLPGDCFEFELSGCTLIACDCCARKLGAAVPPADASYAWHGGGQEGGVDATAQTCETGNGAQGARRVAKHDTESRG